MLTHAIQFISEAFFLRTSCRCNIGAMPAAAKLRLGIGNRHSGYESTKMALKTHS